MSSVRAAKRAGHCQLAGAISRATKPGTIAHATTPIATPPKPNHSCRFFCSASVHADPAIARSSAMTRALSSPALASAAWSSRRAALPAAAIRCAICSGVIASAGLRAITSLMAAIRSAVASTPFCIRPYVSV